MSKQKKPESKKGLPAYFVRELSGYYQEREARNIAHWVVEDLTGMDILKLLSGMDEAWSEDEISGINLILARLKEGEPIQYILGYAEFYGLNLKVGPGVLIPRNETEELVEWIISENIGKADGCRILDIGCGSGAIAISLAKEFPGAEVIAADISDEALRVCKENAEKHSVRVCCSYFDILNPTGELADQEYDFIISNPPYVLESQRPFMEKRVKEMEPTLALFVPDTNPLLFYKAIAAFAKERLKPGGEVYVEINDVLGGETLKEFSLLFSEIELRQDINGKDRMIRVSHGKE